MCWIRSFDTVKKHRNTAGTLFWLCQEIEHEKKMLIETITLKPPKMQIRWSSIVGQHSKAPTGTKLVNIVFVIILHGLLAIEITEEVALMSN